MARRNHNEEPTMERMESTFLDESQSSPTNLPSILDHLFQFDWSHSHSIVEEDRNQTHKSLVFQLVIWMEWNEWEYLEGLEENWIRWGWWWKREVMEEVRKEGSWMRRNRKEYRLTRKQMIWSDITRSRKEEEEWMSDERRERSDERSEWIEETFESIDSRWIENERRREVISNE